MTTNTQTNQAEQLYGFWRTLADRNGVATYGWEGMPDGYRLAWEQFAILLTRKPTATDK